MEPKRHSPSNRECRPTNGKRCRFLWWGIPILISILLLPASAEEGGGRFGIDFRSVYQEKTEYLSNFHIDLWQNWGNVGRIGAWIDWNYGKNSHTVNQLGRGFAFLRGLQLGPLAFDAQAGDFSLRMTNLEEKFSNSSYPDIYFRGVNTLLKADKWQAEFFTGDLTQPEGMLAASFATTGETVTGARAVFLPGNKFRIGATYIACHDEDRAATDPQPVKNQVLTLEGLWAMSKSWKWIGELHANNSRVNGGQPQWGNSLKLGYIAQTQNFQMEMNYRNTDSRYYLFRHASLPDANQQGVFVMSQWQPLKNLHLFGNIDRFVQTIPRPSAQADETNGLRSYLGMQFTPFAAASLSFFYNLTDFRSRPGALQPVDYFTNSIISELRFNLKKTTPYIRFQQFQFKDQLVETNNYQEQIFVFGVRRMFSSALQTYLEAYYNKRDSLQAGIDRWEGKFGFSYFQGKFSCWGEAIYTLKQNKTVSGKDETLAGFVGISAPFFFGSNLYLDLRYDRMLDSPVTWINQDKLQLTFRLSKRLKWGQPRKIAGLKAGMDVKGSGSIEGVVFNDKNSNNILDPGEETLGEGIVVRLEDGSTTHTNRQGEYSFPRVSPGWHTLSLDIRNIPIQYNLLSGEIQQVEVKIRSKTTAHFTFISSANIQGRVIFDSNGNGKLDNGEQGMPDILVYLNEGDINTYTDGEGNFAFLNLNPGIYTLKIDSTTLPENSLFSSPKEFTIELHPGDTMKNYDFYIFIKQRPVIIQRVEQNRRFSSGSDSRQTTPSKEKSR